MAYCSYAGRSVLIVFPAAPRQHLPTGPSLQSAAAASNMRRIRYLWKGEWLTCRQLAQTWQLSVDATYIRACRERLLQRRV